MKEILYLIPYLIFLKDYRFQQSIYVPHTVQHSLLSVLEQKNNMSFLAHPLDNFPRWIRNQECLSHVCAGYH